DLPRAEALGEIPFQGHQPGLGRDEEEIEGVLDVRFRPAMPCPQRQHEQRPGILEIGDGNHARDPGDELHPAVGEVHTGSETRVASIVRVVTLYGTEWMPSWPARCHTTRRASREAHPRRPRR